MSETNFDWNDLKLFLAVARNRGLSSASRAIGSSPPTLGRRMRDLEAATGAELFRRHARGYELTDQGEALFLKALELEASIRPLFESRRGDRKTLVKVSAGAWTLHALCRNIAAISANAPDALMRFISADEFLNINHREAVIGVRNQRPEQSGLAGRRIATVSFAGYAADPSISAWIRVTASTPSAKWLAARSDAGAAMEVNSSQLAKDLAVQGVGRVVLPCFIGDHEPALSRVTEPIPELDHDQWLVSHDDDRSIPAVRQVLDAMMSVLQAIHGASR